jgi:hypothetical protein
MARQVSWLDVYALFVMLLALVLCWVFVFAINK